MTKFSSEFSVEKMAAVLNVSRSGYYHWLGRPMSRSAQERQRFDIEVKSAFESGKGHYGRDRVRLELDVRGRKACRKRVGASMDRQNLRFKAKKRFRATTNSKHDLPVAPNLLNRNFSTSEPNRVLVTDITYLPCRTGWLYLTVFIDLFSRMVVGMARKHFAEPRRGPAGPLSGYMAAWTGSRDNDPFRPRGSVLLRGFSGGAETA
jgi:putative transposase